MYVDFIVDPFFINVDQNIYIVYNILFYIYVKIMMGFRLPFL